MYNYHCIYADDLVLLAPSRSDLTTALEELERKWGMVVNYPKTEAVVFGLPDATAAAAAKIQVGSNSVAVKPQFKYVGSIVQADGDSPPGGWGWAPSSSSINPWCCHGSCTAQRSLGPSQRHRGHNWRPSTMAA